MYTLDQVSLRPLDNSDLEWLRSLRNDESTWTNLGDPKMVSDVQQQLWFNGLTADRTRMYLVVSYQDIAVGIVRMTQIDLINRSACIGMDIASEYRGQGIGSKAYTMLIKYCFHVLNLHRIWLLVIDFNARARHLYESVGFQEEGRMRQAIYRNGQYHDYICMSILSSEYATL